MAVMKRKKIAIISDVLMEYGGAEKVVESFLKIFPEADLYALFIVPNARKRIEETYPKITIHTSVFQRLIRKDKISKYVSTIKIFSWIYWELLDLKKYDFIISSSHSFMSKNVKKGKNSFHLSYIHTPPRYLYDEFNEISWLKKMPWSWLFWPIKLILRKVDKKGAKGPDVLVANSNNVRERIKKYYGRESVVVYPAVEVGKINNEKNIAKKNYYVCLSRLVKQKGIDLAVKTFTRLKLSLKVIGNGDELIYLKKIASPNIEFIVNCDDEEKIKILSEARALVYTSKEEDFGIVPVEAMAVGVPVIAFRSGGVRETIVEGVTGLFFDDFTVESLSGAIKLFQKKHFTASDCKKQAEKFREDIFRKKIIGILNKGEKI